MRHLWITFGFILILIVCTYVGRQWAQKQAYLVYGRSYTQAITEFHQMWSHQTAYPQSRAWIDDLYFQRRWELLNQWGKPSEFAIVNRTLSS